MNLFNLAVLSIFPLMMVMAALSDLTTMRISNRLVLILTGGFFIAALLANLTLQDFAWHLGTGVAVLVVTFSFFAMGWIGGGDAKFAAATALWLGIPATLPYMVYGGILGGALTLMLLAARRFPLPQPLASVGWIDRLHDQRTGIPYGIALASAGLLTFSGTPIFAALVAGA